MDEAIQCGSGSGGFQKILILAIRCAIVCICLTYLLIDDFYTYAAQILFCMIRKEHLQFSFALCDKGETFLQRSRIISMPFSAAWLVNGEKLPVVLISHLPKNHGRRFIMVIEGGAIDSGFSAQITDCDFGERF